MRNFVAFALLGCGVAFTPLRASAAEKAKPAPAPVTESAGTKAHEEGDPKWELGVSLGPPALLNLNLGYWGVARTPLVLRASGMFYASDANGISLDVGYQLSHSKNFRHYAGLTFLFARFSFITDAEWIAGGFGYGLNFYGIAVSASLLYGQRKTSFLGSAPTVDHGVLPVPQLGLSVLF